MLFIRRIMGFSTIFVAFVVSAQVNAATCTYKVDSEWSSGFTASVTIANTSNTAINGWSVGWKYNTNKVTNAWNTTLTGANPYTAKDVGWNASIQPGQSVNFGFQANKNGSVLEKPVITGAVCGTRPASSLAKSSLAKSSTAKSVIAKSSVAKSSVAKSVVAKSSIANSVPAKSVAAKSSAAPVGKLNAWSNPLTWGGRLPNATTNVVIPAGKTVILDSKVNVQSLTVEGTLTCANGNIAIEAKWIMVMGNNARFLCGTKEQRFKGDFDITLTGQKGQDDAGMNMGTRVLGAMSGGVIAFYGEARTSWLKLDATAMRGTSDITLTQVPVNWRPGMNLVLAPSDENPRHAEVRGIKSIAGKQVTLSAPLTFDHYGEQLRYANASQNWVVDTRAPVGLLSHNITIQGAEDSVATQFGAHVMIMITAKAFFSDVGFYRVGQKSILGRYPFHWHEAGNVDGQFIVNSSIQDSYNRCVTVHSSHNSIVQNNVCYNHLGHGYFLEDGDEEGNLIQGNLGLLSVRPKDGEEILDTDISTSPAVKGPATFWISNPNNRVEGNYAGGSDGIGYWYHLEDKLVPRVDGTTVNPRNNKFGSFNNNIVSSSERGYASCPKGGGTQGAETSNPMTINNFTAFMTTKTGSWPCGGKVQTFNNMKLVDSGRHVSASAFTAPQPMEINKSLFVANSPLAALNGGKVGRSAIGMYDQGFYIHDSHFVGYTKADSSSLLGTVGGAVKNYQNRVERLTFSPAKYAAFDSDVTNSKGLTQQSSVVFDIDGSLGGAPGTQLTPRVPLFGGNNCAADGAIAKLEAGTFGMICKTRLVEARLMGVDVPATSPYNYELFRSNAGVTTATATMNNIDPSSSGYYQAFATPNQAYHYGIRFLTNPGNKFSLLIREAWPNDVIRFEMQGVDARTIVQGSGWRRVADLPALVNATDSVFYKNGTTLQVKFKLPGTAVKWAASANVKLGY